jgi:hypothetical protein
MHDSLEHDEFLNCTASDVERRVNVGTFEIVEQAVDAHRSGGADEARALLAAHRIPEHVVLRVLASAAFRRKKR